ncbi:hypothetical protein, partial [Burkholderia sp. LMG 13014]|uniref:hypothetical protein n=1 Tax=Burkholderia sp. LMG 13014 TaxID=2709306 RepID=UPI0019651C4D
MDAHVEPRRDDQEIVGKRAPSAHGQLAGNSLGQLGGRSRHRIAAGESVSVLKHSSHSPAVF